MVSSMTLSRAICRRTATPETWNWVVLDLEVRGVLTLDVPIAFWMDEADITPQYVRDYIVHVADDWMAGEGAPLGRAAHCVTVQRRIVMALLDDLWLRHVQRVELMRRAAPLRAHARRDPLTEFKIEAFHLFELMLAQLRRNVTAATMRVGFEEEAAAQTSDEEQELTCFPIISSARCTEPDGNACSAGHQPRNGRSAAAPSGCARCGSGTGSAPRSA